MGILIAFITSKFFWPFMGFMALLMVLGGCRFAEILENLDKHNKGEKK